MLADGDFIDLDWGLNRSGPIVVVLPGLEGDSRSPYVQGLLSAVEKRGWQGVAMHFRGCSGEPNRLPRSYHSGDSADLAELVDMLKAREPNTPLCAVGFSLGGNVLLKYLGEKRPQVLLDSAVAVCTPMVLSECATRLEHGLSRFYQWWLLHSLKKKIRRKFATIAAPINLERVRRCTTFREFDGEVTAPLHGFRDADDYYQKASARQFLAKITTPTLVIHAQDDPFMSQHVLATPQEVSPQVTIEVSRSGGHIGFVAGTLPFWPRYWLDQRIVECIASSIALPCASDPPR